MNLQLQVSISLITKLLRLQRFVHALGLHNLKSWIWESYCDCEFICSYFVPMKRILEGVLLIMSDLNRGIMKFDGADSPAGIALSAVVILGAIGLLVLWAVRSAYLF
jgi:hypothetical protein